MYLRSCLHTTLYTCILSYLFTYVLAFSHSYVLMYLCTCVHMFSVRKVEQKHAEMQVELGTECIVEERHRKKRDAGR